MDSLRDASLAADLFGRLIELINAKKPLTP
jgi:hypothetical protein